MSTSGRESLLFEILSNRASMVSKRTLWIIVLISKERPGAKYPSNEARIFLYLKSAEIPNARDFHGDERANEAENDVLLSYKCCMCVRFAYLAMKLVAYSELLDPKRIVPHINTCSQTDSAAVFLDFVVQLQWSD